MLKVILVIPIPEPNCLCWMSNACIYISWLVLLLDVVSLIIFLCLHRQDQARDRCRQLFFTLSLELISG